MNLSIEDLEAIKAIVRKTVREELERATRHEAKANAGVQPTQQQEVESKPAQPEQPAEVVARIRRS
jgi:hypothetical protein